MLSAKDLRLDMLSLGSENREILEKLPLEEVVLEIRQGIFPSKNFVRIISPDHYCYDDKATETLKQLGVVLKKEFERLELFRKDFSPLRMTANIFAVIQFVEENGKRWPRYYFDSEKFIIRLIQRLDNEAYETWNGLNLETIEEFRNLIRDHLANPEYHFTKMRFGLDDGECIDRKSIMDFFDWHSESNARYHERKIQKELGPLLPTFKALAKLPQSSPGD